MKILFLSHGIPNRFNRIRASNTIQCLTKSHEVHVLCLAYNPYNKLTQAEACGYEGKTIIEEIPLLKIVSLLNCAKNVFSELPFRVAYCKSTKFSRRLKEIIEKHKFDCIYVKRKRMAQFVEDINTPKILDLTDSVAFQYERLAEYSEGVKTFLFGRNKTAKRL